MNTIGWRGGTRGVVQVMVGREQWWWWWWVGEVCLMGKNVEKVVWQSRDQTDYLLLARTTLKDLMLPVSSMFKKCSQRFVFFFHFLCASEKCNVHGWILDWMLSNPQLKMRIRKQRMLSIFYYNSLLFFIAFIQMTYVRVTEHTKLKEGCVLSCTWVRDQKSLTDASP